MPRINRRSRQSAGTWGGDIERRVRYLMESKYGFLDCDLSQAGFHRTFPTPEHRELFQELYASEFFDIWNFETEALYPGWGFSHEALFHRMNFLEFAGKRKLSPFEPPVCSADPPEPWKPDSFGEAYRLTVARATWWKRNKLPTTPAERTFLANPAERLAEFEAELAEKRKNWNRSSERGTDNVVPITAS